MRRTQYRKHLFKTFLVNFLNKHMKVLYFKWKLSKVFDENLNQIWRKCLRMTNLRQTNFRLWSFGKYWNSNAKLSGLLHFWLNDEIILLVVEMPTDWFSWGNNYDGHSIMGLINKLRISDPSDGDKRISCNHNL